jgi:hypothetical protein
MLIVHRWDVDPLPPVKELIREWLLLISGEILNHFVS